MKSFRHSILLLLLALFSAIGVTAQEREPIVIIDQTADTGGEYIREISTYLTDRRSYLLMTDVPGRLTVSPDGELFIGFPYNDNGDYGFLYGGFLGQMKLVPLDFDTEEELASAVFSDDSWYLAHTISTNFFTTWELDFIDLAMMFEEETMHHFSGEIESNDQIDTLPPFTFYGAPRVVRWIGDRAYIVPSGPNGSNYGELFMLDLSAIESDSAPLQLKSVLQPLYEQYPEYFLDVVRFEGSKSVPGIGSNWKLSPNGRFLATPYHDPAICEANCPEAWPNAIVIFDLESNTLVTSFPATTDAYVMDLLWSEDGQQLLYVTGAQLEDRFITPTLTVFDAQTGEKSGPKLLIFGSGSDKRMIEQGICGDTYFYTVEDSTGEEKLYHMNFQDPEPPLRITEGETLYILGCQRVKQIRQL